MLVGRRKAAMAGENRLRKIPARTYDERNRGQ
jgi:hypothetical protein